MESLCDQNDLQESIYHYDSWPSDNMLSCYVGENFFCSRWYLPPKSFGLYSSQVVSVFSKLIVSIIVIFIITIIIIKLFQFVLKKILKS